ncbi:MAG TPA: D-arabinono-1,4-lactone oxidase [Actinocrinis sp.]|uniref:D-arabinono-1,4-lactone oxidase n=1 Tax=Actinocrinis sp. TaxID=1920516 RepID=UPI002DDCD1BD|nr:D-arabinono-1,4-lactone oxidase [Actinocrinis sp.]HEV2345883.1 D-arabinono-1,4-lactone oxidase [Actinocrinis sp.]
MLTNWAGNIEFRAERVHRPQTVAELRELVAASAGVRALGTGHSFNRIADTPADLVSVAGLPRVIEIDTAAATVTVSAGLRYAEVAERLNQAGYALPNLASLPHISIAGACATGTHGSGDRNGGLATAVAALRIVGPGGEPAELSRRDDPERFPGAVVGLGAFGVVTELTLELLSSFEVAQYVYEGLALDVLAERFDAVFGAAYSVSVFTNWADGDGAVWLKTRHESGEGAPQSLLDVLGPKWLGARPADGPRHPIPGMPAGFCTVQGGVPGPWHERLPHFRPDFTPSSGEELQSEFLLPRAAAPQAIAALRGLADRIAPVLQISELRTIAADDLWLSPAYGRDSVAFHFTWVADTEAVTPVLAAVEERLMPLGARPHWGKLFTTPPQQLADQYERWDDFRRLLLAQDPEGTFRNAFVDSLFPSLRSSD